MDELERLREENVRLKLTDVGSLAEMLETANGEILRLQEEVKRLTEELEGVQAEARGACRQHHAQIEALESQLTQAVPRMRSAEEWATIVLNGCHHENYYDDNANEFWAEVAESFRTYAREVGKAVREEGALKANAYPTDGRQHLPRGHGWCEDFGCDDFDALAIAIRQIEVKTP